MGQYCFGYTLSNRGQPFHTKTSDMARCTFRAQQESEAGKKANSRKTQLESLKKELLEVTTYHNDKAELNQLFLVSLIKVAMYGAIGTIYGAIFPFLGELSSWNGVGGVMGRTGAQITALAVAMLIFITCSQTMRMHKKIRDFPEYEKNTKELISELEKDNV